MTVTANRWRALALAAGLLGALACAAQAPPRYDGPMRFLTFRPCADATPACAPRILAEGTIRSETGSDFTAFLDEAARQEPPLPAHATVVFDSRGGSLRGAVALGREIRKRLLATEVAPAYAQAADAQAPVPLREQAVCASACAMAFAGGVSRTLRPGARLGIHQFSTAQGQAEDGAVQATMVALAAYLQQMGVDRRLLDKASLVPPKAMAWVSAKEAQDWRLDNAAPLLRPWRLAATPQGVPYLETQQEAAPGRGVLVRLGVGNRQGLLLVMGMYDKALLGAPRLDAFPVADAPALRLCTPQRCLAATVVKPWERREGSARVGYSALMAIPPDELRALAGAGSLRLEQELPEAASDLRLDTPLSTEGFDNGLALLLRGL